MKVWFKTQQHQILNLTNCLFFWIEEIPYENPCKFIVFCQTDDKIEWKIANFELEEDARTYINQIYIVLLDKVGCENET